MAISSRSMDSDPISDIRTIIGNHYNSNSILKELIQNARDAGASTFYLKAIKGNLNAEHELLKLDALLVFNDGEFSNLLLGEHNELKNRYCHIRYTEQSAKSEGGQKTDFGGQKKWSETTQKIYELIKENPSMSRKKLSDTLSINPSAVQKHIEKLKKEGIIIRKNGAKGGHWEVL